ncbi:MAG TPA: pentapeptide repeat-containing protein [Solirubrobacterales bacterium]
MEPPPEVSPAPPDLAPEHLEARGEVLLGPGVEVEDAEIERLGVEEEAGSGRIVHARIGMGDLGGARLRDLRLVDVVAESLDAANGDWRGASLSRVELRGCRLTGVGLVEATLEDVVLDDCKLDLANFRGARLERVVFRDCVLTAADFGGAALTGARFDHCHLEEADFNGSELTDVDLRGSDLRLGGDVAALRGAIIDTGQAIELAPRMAASLGLRVIDR